MNKGMFRQISVIVSFIIMVVVNVMSNTLPFNGITAPEIADQFEVYFVPAGYVFSIWSLIYLGVLAYVVYQSLPAQRENPRLQRTGWWFVLSSAANSIWLFLWHYGYYGLSVLAMLTLLISLILIYLGLGVGRQSVSSGERWLSHFPFSIYVGWITVATIANITTYLDFVNWNGFGLSPEAWMFTILAVAIAIAGLVAYTRRDIAYLLVLIWAFLGIGVEQSGTPQIASAANVAAAIVGVFVVLVSIQTLRKSRRAGMSPS